MKFYLSLLALFLFVLVIAGCGYLRPQNPKERPYRTIPVVFPGGADDVRLAGELTLPYGDGPFPAIILISGSGPQNRDEEMAGHKPFLVLSDHLTRNGFAVLRYDDRGVSESTGDYSGADLPDFSEDAVSAFNWLAEQAHIDADCIGYLGHSEGGYIAPMAAQKTPAAFMVFLAGPARRLLPDVMVAQGIDILRSQNKGNAEIETLKSQYRDLIHILKTSATKDEAEARLNTLLTAERVTKSQRKAVLETWASRWGMYYADYNPLPALVRYGRPVLALYGSKDLQVSAKENASIMRSALSHPLSQVKTLENHNHLFQYSVNGKIDEYPLIRTTIEPEVLEIISSWLNTATTTKNQPATAAPIKIR